METKKIIRQNVEAKRRALSPAWVTQQSPLVVKNCQQLEAFLQAKTVALYQPLPGEVDVRILFERCWTQKKNTAIPLFCPDEKIYRLAHVDDRTSYTTGHYGIQEPINPTFMDSSKIDLFIVPGVAFDSQGGRLGRGGGYYDRLIPLGTPAIGVGFSFQLIDHVPQERHDHRMQAIATEKQLLIPSTNT